MPRNIEARKVLVSHSGPRGMTAVGGEVAWAMWTGMLTQGWHAAVEVWTGCGRLDLVQIHSPLFPCGKEPTLHSGELPIHGYRNTVSQDELMCGEGSRGGLDH